MGESKSFKNKSNDTGVKQITNTVQGDQLQGSFIT